MKKPDLEKCVVQNHGDRIEALEREEFYENTDDASLM